jgi:hypothetical protein
MIQPGWTPSPTGERDRAVVRRRTGREDLLLVFSAGLIVSSGLVAAILLFTHPSGPTSFLEVVYLAFCAWGLVRVFRRNADLAREMRLNENGLVEEFGGGDGWLVDVLVLQGTAPTGADRGMLWIEGDRLFFAGYRTSFALTANEVAGRMRSACAVGGLRHNLRLPLASPTPAGRLSLSLNLRGEGLAAFYRRIDDWASHPSAAAGQLPPLTIGPGATSPAKLLAGGLAYLAGGAGLLGLLLFAAKTVDSFGLLFAAAMPAAWIVLGAMRLRALRDRRRLDRAFADREEDR